ncbi:MAG: DNA mismatch repair protein MutS [Treponemataceae bacterium]|nr:DNA mismatch repair protein MutS [Treponemataceae bacterium]
MGGTTPLMDQYAAIKDQYKDEVLFFRLGDFYEMFNEDAVEVSRLLNLTLTSRAGQPMCGIPYHASKIYIARLLRMGKKIAVCEQMSLPENGKGLAERKVVEIITPGSTVEEEYLEKGCNNYIACLCFSKDKKNTWLSYACADISTGTFFTRKWPESKLKDEFSKELGRNLPREIVLPSSMEKNAAVMDVLETFPATSITWEQDWHFSQELSYKKLLSQFGTTNLKAFCLLEDSPEVLSSGCLLAYLSRTANTASPDAPIPQVRNIRILDDNDFVVIDDSSRRNLEITTNLRDGNSQYTLLETINYTMTAMGSRLLRNRLIYPLRSTGLIKKRQQRISLFIEDRKLLQETRNLLASILDVERLASRIGMERAHAKDLQALRVSLSGWIDVRNLLSAVEPVGGIELGTAMSIIKTVQDAILPEPSIQLSEGGMIKPGWSEELDHYRNLQGNFNKILDEYITEEKEKTGIQNLKIKYQKNIGYFMEVSKGKIDSVPSHFILRRALVNGDRYTSPKLQELEQELLSAGEKIIETEKGLFLEIRAMIATHIPYLLEVALEIAEIDTTASLAYAALVHNWTCPEIDDSDVLEIKAGRHPVVENHMASGNFVPNDTLLGEKKFALVTGPNMAGKSTYLRQNALIVLLAQIGSFVPAEKAHIGVVDRIFCRVGASDNLARGESTFLVEMAETAHILRAATCKSLVIMDEVGRGTSTGDGLSLAWAISEYILNVIKAKTFFATHYHELTNLSHPSLVLLCMDVLEKDGEVVFLKHIRSGSAAGSYGIHVARLAGIPEPVLKRASDLLDVLEQNALHTELLTGANLSVGEDEPCLQTQEKAVKTTSAGLFSEEELVINEILSISPDEMTPLEALQRLALWRKRLMNQ